MKKQLSARRNLLVGKDKQTMPGLIKEIQYILDHLDDADSKTAFIDMMHGHIGNEIYKGNN